MRNPSSSLTTPTKRKPKLLPGRCTIKLSEKKNILRGKSKKKNMEKGAKNVQDIRKFFENNENLPKCENGPKAPLSNHSSANSTSTQQGPPQHEAQNYTGLNSPKTSTGHRKNIQYDKKGGQVLHTAKPTEATSPRKYVQTGEKRP